MSSGKQGENICRNLVHNAVFPLDKIEGRDGKGEWV